MKLFLGVDGGQSSTVALIADETGRVLGTGIGGPCNHVANTEAGAKFSRAMAECLSEACTRAGVPTDSIFEAACLGFSGGIEDKEVHSRAAVRSKAFKITHDAEIALTGATEGEPGIIVIAGTGSIAFGKNAAGRTMRAGGWGYIFGDEGGGFDLIRQSLRAALAMEEGWGDETVLRGLLLAKTKSKSADQLMHDWYNHFRRSEIDALTPLLVEAAKQEDAVANKILENAARQLMELVNHVHKQLFEKADLCAVSYVGGVFEISKLTISLQDLLRQNLKCEVAPPRLPPAAGALIEAFRLAGMRCQLSNLPTIKS